MTLAPVVVIAPNSGPFHFDEADEAEAMAEELRQVVHKYLPWNQALLGPLAWVETRECV